MKGKEIVVRLDIARPEIQYYVDGGDFRVPDPKYGRRHSAVPFVFDSGATHSVLSGRLAVALGLNLKGKLVKVTVLADSLIAVEAGFRVAIGREWVLLPCLVRCRPSGEIIMTAENDENLLGLAGLLDRYEITLSKDTLSFRRNAE